MTLKETLKELELKVTQSIDEAITILKDMPEVSHVQRALKHLQEARQEISPNNEALESWGWLEDDHGHELPKQ